MENQPIKPHGRIAFITTPAQRKNNAADIKHFICRHLYFLAENFVVISTGGTYEFSQEYCTRIEIDKLSDKESDLISKSLGLSDVSSLNNDELERWKSAFQRVERGGPNIVGMILVAHELVEGCIDGLIHLTDWDDVSGKPDSMVLRREANVHNLPIALDSFTANAMIDRWKRAIENGINPFRDRVPMEGSPLAGLSKGESNLALIAHDEKKLDMCLLIVENAEEIFAKNDYILATGTTGRWIKRFLKAAGRPEDEISRVRLCLSGPYGGDVQIAAAVVSGLCQKVIFFQDPFSSHPHESDIRLFEQAVLCEDVDVALATNPESARLILGR